MLWIGYSLFIAKMIVITVCCSSEILREHRHRCAIGYKFDFDDFNPTKLSFVLLPICGFGIGVISGSMGIGGGIIVAPLLLFLGLHPLVVSATTNFIVLYTSGCSTVQFIFYVKS